MAQRVAMPARRRTKVAGAIARTATAMSTPFVERRMRRYITEELYTPLRGLSGWLEPRSDRGITAKAIRVYDEDVYETRVVDIREPALLEPRSGYVFLRRGPYRPSFNWWQYADVPHVTSFGLYANWLARPHRVDSFPEAVSFRTHWEPNYWHCYDEILSKLLLMERLDLPADVPLLISPRLWAAPFFQGMRSARALRDRNWVVHDRPVWSNRLILCIQGPTSRDSPPFVRDLFRDGEAAASVATHAPNLLLTRPTGFERHVENEDELAVALADQGFEAIDPEQLPFWEQVERFRAARCVVTVHGAALANLVHRFGTPTGLVELFPNDADFVRRVIGPWLSREAGFAYRAVVGSPMAEDGSLRVSAPAVAAAVSAVLQEVDAAERSG